MHTVSSSDIAFLRRAGCRWGREKTSRIPKRLPKMAAPVSILAVLRAFWPSETSPDPEFWAIAPSVRNAGQIEVVTKLR
jgi:hypothetical protein